MDSRKTLPAYQHGKGGAAGIESRWGGCLYVYSPLV